MEGLFDRRGLRSPMKFPAARLYETFTACWGGFCIDRLDWIDVWAKNLDAAGIDQPAVVDRAASYCVAHLRRPPTWPEFRLYCQRAAAGESMDEPLVTQEERIARQLIELFGADVESEATLARACLVAAAVLRARQRIGDGMPWSELSVEADIAGEARAFGMESLQWLQDARRGRGFWQDVLFERPESLAETDPE